jgi:hypothetical protein
MPYASWNNGLQGWLLRTLSRLEDALEEARRRLSPAPVTLFKDVTAPWLASALCLAARLRLADHLGQASMPVEQLAGLAAVPPEQLARLLAILQAHGYFRLEGDGRVRATRLSRALRRDVAGSFVELQGRGWYRQAFLSSHILDAWRSGRNAFEVATGEHFFDYCENDAGAGGLFLAAMADVTRFCTPYLAAKLVLRPGERFLDVGGGDGELARALARRYPGNDLAVLDRSLTDTSLCGKTPNYRFHQGDFFTSLPKGYGHLCLKNILHDWEDDLCLRLLERCREAVEPGARLSVIECPLPEAGESSRGSRGTFALDWNVWLTLSGRERTCSAYFALLQRAGWQATASRPTATPYDVLEATAV